MGNNVRALRLAFLLTPKELAERMGADVRQIKRLEASEGDLSEEWVEAVSRALGVPASAVIDPFADIAGIAARAARRAPPQLHTCPIGARFAIQALVAKLGGLDMALSLSEDELGRTVQNLISYLESDDGDSAEERFNRLSRALQIVSLTVLQSRGFVPGADFQEKMSKALLGAMSLLRAFSEIGPAGADSES
jgi:transcriptional regulator with XRE-family HTH domain